jgi:hypothetical protein
MNGFSAGSASAAGLDDEEPNAEPNPQPFFSSGAVDVDVDPSDEVPEIKEGLTGSVPSFPEDLEEELLESSASFFRNEEASPADFAAKMLAGKAFLSSSPFPEYLLLGGTST